MLKTLVAAFAGLVLIAAAALYLLARNAKPLPGIREQLATLPESEREALRKICAAAGLEGGEFALRPIGGIYDGILRAPANRNAVWMDQGHVRGLGLTGAKFAAAQSPLNFGPLRSLEVLWLENGDLSAWPHFAGLDRLRELNLNGNPLPTPAQAGAVPLSLQKLQIARARLGDLTLLTAGLEQLVELDASDNGGIQTLEPLLALPKLERVNLARTAVASLPERLGNWQVDLEGTPVLQPAGFSWKGPGSYSFSGTGLGDTTVRGIVSAGKVDVSGTASEVPALRPVSLPTNRGGSESIGPVVVEASIATGKARLWLVEGPGWFSSPWFVQGKVKGFGFARRSGWVVTRLNAGQVVQARGNLSLTGPIEHSDFHFHIEPLEGTRVTGLRYRVFRP